MSTEKLSNKDNQGGTGRHQSSSSDNDPAKFTGYKNDAEANRIQKEINRAIAESPAEGQKNDHFPEGDRRG